MISRFHSFSRKPFYVFSGDIYGFVLFVLTFIPCRWNLFVTITDWCLSWVVSSFTDSGDWEGVLETL